MGAFDNGFRLNPATQPVDGDVMLYDAATDGVRPGGAVPGAVGVPSADNYGVASGNVAAGTSLGAGATEIDSSCRVTFTAPSSGRVLVEMTAFVSAQGASGSIYYWYPRLLVDATNAEASKPPKRVAIVESGASALKQWITVKHIFSGLTAGVVYRVEWQHAATVSGYSVVANSSQGNEMVLTALTVP